LIEVTVSHASRHRGDERPPRRDRPQRRPGAHALLLPDGAGWHGASALAVPDTITLLHLPPYAPESNPVENVRACLRANTLAITVFGTCDDIAGACCKARNFCANSPEAIASITSRQWAQVK
jgi:hypothetical protein